MPQHADASDSLASGAGRQQLGFELGCHQAPIRPTIDEGTATVNSGDVTGLIKHLVEGLAAGQLAGADAESEVGGEGSVMSCGHAAQAGHSRSVCQLEFVIA
jgi:hypothetical protein